PYVQSEGMRAVLFPGLHDQGSLDYAWKTLQSIPVLEKNSSSSIENVNDASALEGEKRESEVVKEAEVDATQAKRQKAKSDGPRVAALAAGRVRRNALMCSAIW